VAPAIPVVPPAPVLPPPPPPAPPPPGPVDWQAAISSTSAKKMERPMASTFGLIDTYCRDEAMVVTKSESGQDEAV